MQFFHGLRLVEDDVPDAGFCGLFLTQDAANCLVFNAVVCFEDERLASFEKFANGSSGADRSFSFKYYIAQKIFSVSSGVN